MPFRFIHFHTYANSNIVDKPNKKKKNLSEFVWETKEQKQ